MASVYIADGDKQLAEREYKEALRSEPRNSMAQNNYGTFLFSEERYKDAMQHLKIAANDPSYARRGQAYENLGLTQLKLNEPADAEQSFLRALMLNSAQPRAALELADLYFKAGDFTRSKQYSRASTRWRDRLRAVSGWVFGSVECWTTRISCRVTRWL